MGYIANFWIEHRILGEERFNDIVGKGLGVDEWTIKMAKIFIHHGPDWKHCYPKGDLALDRAYNMLKSLHKYGTLDDFMCGLGNESANACWYLWQFNDTH